MGVELDGTFDFVVPIRISRQMMLDIDTMSSRFVSRWRNYHPQTSSSLLESGRVSAGINSEIGTPVTRPQF